MKKAEDLIKDISEGKNLSFEESKVIFLSIMSGNIKEDLIENKITSRTKALLPVHLNGNAVDMDKINIIAKKHKLVVIEDACPSFMSKFPNQNNFLSTGSVSFDPPPATSSTLLFFGSNSTIYITPFLLLIIRVPRISAS